MIDRWSVEKDLALWSRLAPHPFSLIFRAGQLPKAVIWTANLGIGPSPLDRGESFPNACPWQRDCTEEKVNLTFAVHETFWVRLRLGLRRG